jgi:hypothetical protein
MMVGVALLLAAMCEPASPSQVTDGTDCSSRYEQEVANLLGCCGDIQVPNEETDTQRANEALKKIEFALTQKCLLHSSPHYFELLLDRAGAHLMHARTELSLRASSGKKVADKSSLDEAREAVTLLEAFAQRHPIQAAQEWRWIAGTLQKAGDPWAALYFLSNLSPKCCSDGELDEVRGGLLFELEMFREAAESYTRWIELQFPAADGVAMPSVAHGSSGQSCGHETSLANAAVLRNKGFDVPDVVIEQNGVCEVLDAHTFYVRLPLSSSQRTSAPRSGTSRDTLLHESGHADPPKPQ